MQPRGFPHHIEFRYTPIERLDEVRLRIIRPPSMSQAVQVIDGIQCLPSEANDLILLNMPCLLHIQW